MSLYGGPSPASLSPVQNVVWNVEKLRRRLKEIARKGGGVVSLSLADELDRQDKRLEHAAPFGVEM